MKVRWHALLIGSLGALLPECGQTLDPTEVMVIVNAEPGIVGQTETLHVVVRGGRDKPGDRSAYDRRFSVGAGDLDWPHLTALAPEQADAGRVYEFVATALDGDGNLVAEVRAISGYVANKRLALLLLLEDSCISKTCTGNQTCKKGDCGSAKVDAAQLLAFSDDAVKTTATDGGARAGNAGGSGNRGASGAGGAPSKRAGKDGGPDSSVGRASDASADSGGGPASDASADSGGGPASDGSARADAGPIRAGTRGNFDYTPANFDPATLDFDNAPSAQLDCQSTTTIDTSAPVSITNWCGTAPTPVVVSQSGGPDLVILPLQALSIASTTTLRVIGNRPLIFAVGGDVTIAGVVDASASGTTAGAGGNWSCGASQGGNGSGSTARNKGASGGGGGGFGTVGGKGGVANTDGCCGGGSGTANIAGGVAGANRGGTALNPLLGGCAGGQGGACTTAGGAGGGAVQVSASGAINVTGAVRANGGVGGVACGANDEGGGSGGGSGGAILLEGPMLTTTSATLQANGGAGGPNGNYCAALSCGGTSGGGGSTSSANTGRAGIDTESGGSGGGGGYGRIQTLTR